MEYVETENLLHFRFCEEAIMHEDVQIVGKDATHDKASWQKVVEGIVNDKRPLLAEEVIEKKDYILLKGKAVVADGTTMPLATKFFFKDGKIINTEPLDRTIYDKMSKE